MKTTEARWQVLRPEHSLKSKSSPDIAASKADGMELLLSTLSRFRGTQLQGWPWLWVPRRLSQGSQPCSQLSGLCMGWAPSQNHSRCAGRSPRSFTQIITPHNPSFRFSALSQLHLHAICAVCFAATCSWALDEPAEVKKQQKSRSELLTHLKMQACSSETT